VTLDGDNPQGDFEPAGLKLPAQVAGILQKFDDLFFVAALGKLVVSC
jgi:hypothetical protein